MNRQRNDSELISPAIVLLFLCAALGGLAHAGTTGQLSGRVVDEEGIPLPGVTVSISSPIQIGGVLTTQTDIDGWFQYPRLSPGYFTVLLELEGFLAQELTEVQVRLDHMTEVRVTLVMGMFGDEVTVTETTPVVDPQQVSTGQTFTAEYLQEATLGMENRYYLGMLGQSPGVEANDAWVRVMGSTRYDNNYLVDGMDITDPRYLVSGFESISFEAIDEVAFHTAGFEAEYGRATGGVVNLVTKSGGNRFRGSIDYRYAGSDFQTGGEHWDPDEQPTQSSDLNASLGGPVLHDRLWFFAALENYRQDLTPTGAPTTEQTRMQNYLAKLTWQASPGWSLVGKLIANPITWDNYFSDQFTAPEANYFSSLEHGTAQLDASGMLSDSLLVGLRVGGLVGSWEYEPQNGDLTTIGHYNYVTGESYGSAGGQNFDERNRREIDTDLSWFIDDVYGSHDLKAGAKLTDSQYDKDNCRTGSGRTCEAGVEGYYFYDILDEQGNIVPLEFDVQEAVGKQEFTGRVWSVYLQDSWRIRPDLTLKAGLRWDRSTQTNDVGAEIADLEMLQPRVGLAWDLRNNGRDLLRASWGRFMHPSSLHIAEFTAERSTPIEAWTSCSYLGLAEPALCEELAASEGFGYRTDQEAWDSAGWVLLPSMVFSSEPNQTSPDLEPMYADELVLAYERELHRRTSLEVSYVNKTTNRVIEDTCNGNIPTPTEGADCSFYVVTNIPGLAKDYEALILRLESRAYDRLHLIGSYVLSDTKGAVPIWDTTSSFDLYPWHFVNQYGYLNEHSRHRIKVNGYVFLPLDISLAVNGWWSSEFRWTPRGNRAVVPEMSYGQMFLEPRGSRSEPGLYQLDLQVGKGFTWGHTRLRLLATVYNALDSETATRVCEQATGCGAFEMGDPIEWQQPRRYELGLRVEF